jgi:hypothetical protein
MSTEPNQVKWVGIRLAAGETALPVSMTMDYIRDTDNDTKVQTEESADEDKVRIDTAGVERVVIDLNGIDVKSHRLFGLAAPTTAGDGIRQTTKITEASLEDAVDKKHTQSHAITSTSDHSSTATNGKLLKANANGLPVDATNTDTEVADAVTKKHTQNTDKIIKDTDADTSIDTEESADADTIVGKVVGVECLRFHNSGIVDLPKQSCCKVYRSGNQSINNQTYTKIQYNAEDWDTQNEFDSTTNYRFTVTKAGKYLIMGHCYLDIGADQIQITVALYKNGASTNEELYYQSSGTGVHIMPFLFILSLAVNDYIEIYYEQRSGVAKNILGSMRWNHLVVSKIE